MKVYFYQMINVGKGYIIFIHQISFKFNQFITCWKRFLKICTNNFNCL